MSNDYNIDSILSEVKKRREENEREIKQKEAAEAKKAEPKEQAPVKKAAEKASGPVKKAQAQKPEEAKAAEEKPQVKKEAAKPEAETKKPEAKKEAEPKKAEPKKEAKPEAAAEEEKESSDMVDILEFTEEEVPAEPSEPIAEENAADGKKPPKSKTRKILTAVIVVLLILVVAAAAVFAIKANDWLRIISDNSSDQQVTQEEWQGMKQLIELFDPIEETDAEEIASMEDMIKQWYYNGAPCSSTHVLNVLLIGEDTRGKQILDDNTRADAAIIASVNIDTKEIVLTSILRDSWAYWETEPGNEDSGKFGKLNGAMSTGDLNVYINSVERLYKVDIDGYAIVNFTSFRKIINTLYKDGIELELTEAEIEEINNHPGRYGKVKIEKTFEGDKGLVKLSGRQALAYCRIRHIDTENARADRQKTTLMKIYEDFKDASTSKKVQFINELVPYVKTSFAKGEIIKIASYAFSHGWMDFDIHSFNYPSINVTGGMFNNEFLGNWIWRADFPADAYDMQKRIYGKTSITLAKTRVDVKTVRRTGFYSEGARATYDTIENEAYQEPTTIVPYDDEKDDEESEEE